MIVWCVWTEHGSYEQFSRDLQGIFVTPELADAHANQLRLKRDYDTVEVVENQVLTALPVSVPYVRYSGHIRPDGTEDTGSGYERGVQFSTWSNQLKPLDSSRVAPWSRPEAADNYIEVIGTDETLVAAEYARLLGESRRESPRSRTESPDAAD